MSASPDLREEARRRLESVQYLVSAEARFVEACRKGDWKLAGTLFHSAAEHEAKHLPPGALPVGWTIDAEKRIQDGLSRLDILARGPNGELVEIDWKTTGRSALSKSVRSRNGKARRPCHFGVRRTAAGIANIEVLDRFRPATAA
jgi:hypothetical protein